MTARAVTWYALQFDEGIPNFAPACADGDEVLVRTSSGAVVTCTVDRHRGCYFIGPDGEEVEADAIAHLPRRETRTEADMADRYDTIKLRLPRGYKRRLDALCAAEGQSASKCVATWIDGAERELRELKAR